MDLIEYKPSTFRPLVLIPGRAKPYTASREFNRVEDAEQWARGFVQRPGTFIKLGTSVHIGDRIYAVVLTERGGALLTFVGPKRTLAAT